MTIILYQLDENCYKIATGVVWPLENVQKKLLDFFDSDMFQPFEFELPLSGSLIWDYKSF